jgi:predicted ATPase
MIFAAVNQLNISGPEWISNPADFSSCATFNLIAGKTALHMSEFTTSYHLFGCGIAFLPNNHWVEHYDLSLQLFDHACKAALACGKINDLHLLSDQVPNHAKCFADKLNVRFEVLTSLANSSRSEALETGLELLKLGEDMPTNLSERELAAEVKEILGTISPNFDLLNHNLMNDANKLMAMKYLSQLQYIAHSAKPTLHPFVICRAVQLSIAHGEC